MALTATQKHNIMFHLGYPGKILIPTSTHFNSVVNDRLNNLNAEIEALVATQLADLTAIRAKLIVAQDIVKVKKVGDIELNNNEITQLKGDYRRLSRELSEQLDITLRKSGGVNVSVSL